MESLRGLGGGRKFLLGEFLWLCDGKMAVGMLDCGGCLLGHSLVDTMLHSIANVLVF